MPYRRTGKQYMNGGSALVRAPWEPDDGRCTYTYQQLLRFDNRFRARLLRAFREGTESRESAGGLRTTAVTANAPFHILTAHRRAIRYRDIAGSTVLAP